MLFEKFVKNRIRMVGGRQLLEVLAHFSHTITLVF